MTSDATPDVSLENVEFYDEPLENGELESMADDLENTGEWRYLEILEPGDELELTGRRLEEHLGYFTGDHDRFIVAARNGTINYVGPERTAIEEI